MSKKEHKKDKKHVHKIKKDYLEEDDIYLELEEERKNLHKKKKKKHKEHEEKVMEIKPEKKKKKHHNHEEKEELGFIEKVLKPLKNKKHKKHKENKEIEEDKEIFEKSIIKKKHKTKDEMDRALLGIYENEDGSMPDMSKFQKKKKKSKLFKAFIILILSLLFLGAVAWVGFFVLGTSGNFSEGDILLTMVGDENVETGQTVSYRIRYRNLQNSALHNVVLEVRYPEGFVFEKSSVEPANETKDKWVIGDVVGQAGDFIDISGKLYGDVGKKQSFRVFFNYKPENFSSDFQQVANLSTEIISSPLEISFDGVEAVVAGAEANFKVLIKNTGVESFKNLAVVLTPYVGFSKIESTPKSDEFENFVWSVPVLDGEQSIDVKGIFNVGDYENNSIVASLIGWKDSEKAGDGYIFATSSYNPTLLEKSISAQLAINGSLNDATAVPGDILNGTVTVSNAGDTAISNVRVRMIFDAPSVNSKSILDWITLDDPNNGDVFGEQRSTDIRRGYITWDSGDISELSSIASEKSVLVDYNLPIKTNSEITLADFAKYEITATVEVQYDTAEGREFMSSKPIIIKLNSDANLEISEKITQDSEGRDVHTITWLLTNSFHNLKDLKFEADLYGDFVWDPSTLSVPAGDLNYDPSTKKVTWTIPEMPTSVDVLALQFNIILNKKNPSQANLTSKVKGTIFDEMLGEQFFIIGNEILLQ